MIYFESVPRKHIPSLWLTYSDLVFGPGTSHRPAVIAHTGTRIIGVLSYVRDGETIDLKIVWVANAFRRRGIAAQMLALTEPKRVRGYAITESGRRFLRAARAVR